MSMTPFPTKPPVHPNTLKATPSSTQALKDALRSTLKAFVAISNKEGMSVKECSLAIKREIKRQTGADLIDDLSDLQTLSLLMYFSDFLYGTRKTYEQKQA